MAVNQHSLSEQVRNLLSPKAFKSTDPSPRRVGTPHRFAHLVDHPDLLGATIDNAKDHRDQIPTGFDPKTGEMTWADPDSPVLFLGPSSGGKTSGGAIPAILCAPAGIYGVSARADFFMACALALSRTHEIYCFLSPDPPGATELRWSPLAGCSSWSFANDFARHWTSSIDMSSAGLKIEARQQPHFLRWAARLNAAACYYAATHSKDVEWVVETLGAARLKEDWLPILKELEAEGEAGNADSRKAAIALSGVLGAYDGERSGFFTTASIAWAPYENDIALESTRGADADLDALVRGRPDVRNAVLGLATPGLERWGLPPITGRHAAIFTATGSAENGRQKIVNEFARRLKQAAYKYAEELELVNRPPPLPFTF